MKNISVPVSDADFEKYEQERLARLADLAKTAPVGVPFEWAPPKLNEDGSLAAPEVTKGVTALRGDWK